MLSRRQGPNGDRPVKPETVEAQRKLVAEVTELNPALFGRLDTQTAVGIVDKLSRTADALERSDNKFQDCNALVDRLAEIAEHHKKFGNIVADLPTQRQLENLIGGIDGVNENYDDYLESIDAICAKGDADYAGRIDATQAFVRKLAGLYDKQADHADKTLLAATASITGSPADRGE